MVKGVFSRIKSYIQDFLEWINNLIKGNYSKSYGEYGSGNLQVNYERLSGFETTYLNGDYSTQHIYNLDTSMKLRPYEEYMSSTSRNQDEERLIDDDNEDNQGLL